MRTSKRHSIADEGISPDATVCRFEETWQKREGNIMYCSAIFVGNPDEVSDEAELLRIQCERTNTAPPATDDDELLDMIGHAA